MQYGLRLKAKAENETVSGYIIIVFKVQIAKIIGLDTVGYGQDDKFGRTTAFLTFYTFYYEL